MDLIYLSILFVAIAFAIVAGYLCFILKRVSNNMKTLSSTMSEVEDQFKYITPELTNTIRETDKIVDDAEDKVKATDGVFDSLEDVGNSIISANEAFNNRFGKMTDEEMDREVKPFIEGILWSEAGVRLYSSWQENKKAEKNEVIIRNKNEIAEVLGREG
jgi:uncharacterized protein YoxC